VARWEARVMDEAKLREKLTRIEALFAGATTEGERVAAGEARRRIRERLESAERVEPPVEFRFTLTDTWSRKLFLALLRRYDLKPYRKTDSSMPSSKRATSRALTVTCCAPGGIASGMR
jgi:hypothetical protein